MPADARPELLIVGGPNGAGKSTFVSEYLLTQPQPFVNADLIAAEINPANPAAAAVQAGRELFRRVDSLFEKQTSFILESTLSGKTLQTTISQGRGFGYTTTMVLVFAASPEHCIARVADRVRKGGHHVPDEDVRRRFVRCYGNFWDTYRFAVDRWYIVGNSEAGHLDIANGDHTNVRVVNPALFEAFLALVGE